MSLYLRVYNGEGGGAQEVVRTHSYTARVLMWQWIESVFPEPF